jgi:hypothetical protein
MELTERVEKLEDEVFRNKNHSISSTGVSIDMSRLDYLRELRSAADMCLAILDHVFQSDASNPGLTPDELVAILQQQFGLPVPLATISSSLYKKTGRYVTREPVGKNPVRYRYRILPRGQEYIRKRIWEIKNKTGPTVPKDTPIPLAK